MMPCLIDEETDFDTAWRRLADRDDHATYVLGILAGRVGLTGIGHNGGKNAAVMAYYRVIDRLGWHGMRLWEVFDGECGQDVETFIARLLEEGARIRRDGKAD